jgi:hypothetical protein
VLARPELEDGEIAHAGGFVAQQPGQQVRTPVVMLLLLLK